MLQWINVLGNSLCKDWEKHKTTPTAIQNRLIFQYTQISRITGERSTYHNNLTGWIVRILKIGGQFLPKRYTSNKVHGVTSQKVVILSIYPPPWKLKSHVSESHPCHPLIIPVTDVHVCKDNNTNSARGATTKSLWSWGFWTAIQITFAYLTRQSLSSGKLLQFTYLAARELLSRPLIR
jgi:hypothetical protein